MDLELLESTLADAGEPPFRAKQVWEWACSGVHSYGEMTNLPKPLRARLQAEVPFSTLIAADTALASDRTEKVLFNTLDGRPIETVLMRYRDGRRSVCVSSQSGCPLTCNFCATGRMAFGRNLTASEILDQVLHFRRTDNVNHLVFMGMGEPLMNLDAVIEASRAAARRRRRDLAHDRLHGRLDPRDRAARDRGAADPPGAVAALGRGGRALAADAGQRPLPDPRRARSPACAGASTAASASTSST